MACPSSTAGRQQVDERAELLSFISHELRTPLTSVIGYSEILLSGDAGDLQTEQVAMIQRIATSGARLFELIEALLCAAAERNLHGATVDVSDVLLQAMRSSCDVEGTSPVV
jgi:signal transduction histidine kinase